ncbi:MAG TPA: hypothetical protein VJ692_16670 [Nitrospiraceae bacterium]|nr:hypothetical protein [Nitrospiraceae bacterium]
MAFNPDDGPFLAMLAINRVAGINKATVEQKISLGWAVRGEEEEGNDCKRNIGNAHSYLLEGACLPASEWLTPPHWSSSANMELQRWNSMFSMAS